MPWGAAAAVAGAVIMSSASSSAADSAASAQNQATDAQARANEASLAFQKEQYADAKKRWEQYYGPVEKTLGEYYSSLTPDRAIAQGLASTEQEFSAMKSRINEALSARGLGRSGIAAAVDASAFENLMIQRANVRQTAPMQARAEQLSWLAAGQNNAAQASANMANAYNVYSANASNMYRNALMGSQVSYQQQMQSAAGIGNLLGTVANADWGKVGNYFNDWFGSSSNTATNSPFVNYGSPAAGAEYLYTSSNNNTGSLTAAYYGGMFG